jgi:mono/diheme cytochrome c family protein
MKPTTIAFIALPLALAGLIATTSARAQEKTVWDGVYTDAQAARGQKEYAEACSSCHNTDLSGDGFAPALAGGEFLGNWGGTTVGDFFERIRISMPPSGPNAVSAKGKADIVAFIFKVNKFPAGQAELASETQTLKAIKIEATKP